MPVAKKKEEAEPDVKERPSPIRQLREEEEEALADYLRSLSANGADMVVVVSRLAPKEYEGIPTAGVVETYYEPVSEAEIQSKHGGGQYKITVRQASLSGGKELIKGNKFIRIAGPPKVPGATGPEAIKKALEEHDRERQPDREEPVARRAIDFAEEVAASEKERADRLEDELANERTKAVEPLTAMMRDVMTQQRVQTDRFVELLANRGGDSTEMVRELSAIMRDTQDRFAQILASRGPDKSASDAILAQMLQGESARMQAIVAQTDRELESLRGRHADAIARLEDRHTRELERVTASHEREVDSIRQAHQGEIAAVRSAHQSEVGILRTSLEQKADMTKLLLEGSRDAIKEGLNAQIRALEREVERLGKANDELRTELTEVREKKDATPIERIRDMLELKQAMQELGGPAASEEGKSGGVTGMVERLVETALSSPLAEGFAARLMTPPQSAPVPAMVPQVPVLTPAQQERLRRQVLAEQRRARGVTSTNVEPQEAPEMPAPPAGDVDLSQVVGFLEQAYLNRQKPADLAYAIRITVDGPTREQIKSRSFEEILTAAKLPESSALRTPEGLSWVREVVEALKNS